MSEAREPETDQGRWLLDHQGLVNISRPQQKSYRGDEIDLRASVLTIERQAAEKALHEIADLIGDLDASYPLSVSYVLGVIEAAKEHPNDRR